MSVNVAEHPDLVALPSDSARWTWLMVLTLAKRQPEPGSFRSEAHLHGLLDRYRRRKLTHLFTTGLLEHREDGSVGIHNWPRWQTDQVADATHAQRQREYRERQAKKRANGSQVGREQAAPGPGELLPAGHGWADAEHDSGDVTHVPQPARVTSSDGGPPSQRGDSVTVTPAPWEGGVTGLRDQDELLHQRRDLAKSIRKAAMDSWRERFLTRFEKEYVTYPSGREHRNRRLMHPSMASVIRGVTTWRAA